MGVRVTTGRDGNAANAPYATVHYGPLLFVLPIADLRDGNTPDPAARWKYALDTPGETLGAGITVEHGPMPARWNWPLESPLKLRVPVQSALWDGAVLPAQPVAGRGPAESVALVPYGCTKFRVAFLPLTERTFAKAAANLTQTG